MSRSRLFAVVNTIALVATLVMNFLSQAENLNLFPNTVRALGESRAIFFLPAGYVFSIWGIIYTGLIAFTVYSWANKNAGEILEKISWWFLLSCVANTMWLVLFLYDFVAESTIAMFVLLLSLVMIYIRLGIGKARVSRLVKWVVHIPFSIYLGWITVATVANISAALYVAGSVTGFAGISSDIWAALMMAVAAVIAFILLYTRGDIAYALVVVWALIGIYVRPVDTPVFEVLAGLNAGLVDTVSLVVSVVIVLGCAAALFMRWGSMGASRQTAAS